MFSDKLYDSLKWVAQIFLPALATLYYGLSKVWNLPFPDQVVGTIMALDTLLGFLLGISNRQYKINNGIITRRPMKLSSNETYVVFSMQIYDVAVWVAQYLLPGLATFYFALAGLWGFPYGAEVVGTIAAVDIFLGAILGISSYNYKMAAKSAK